jgi:putative oxidoreductase
MDILFLVGRIFYGGFFLMSGLRHFTQISPISQYAATKGVPAPKLAVAGSGLLIVLGGLSLILGAWTQIGLWLIVIFLVGVSPQMHPFWKVSDPMQKMGEQNNFMKNIALLGAALMMMLLSQPWPYSLFSR